MPAGIYIRTKKQKEKMRGVQNKPEMIEKHRIASIKLWQNQEYRERNKGSIGYKFTEKQRENAGIAANKRWENSEYREKHSNSLKGKQNAKGKRSEKFCKEQSKKFKQLYVEGKIKLPDRTGIKFTEEQLAKMSGKNASNWQGEISFEPYSPEFNKKIKKEIRKQDEYKCQKCGLTQKQSYKKYGRKLDIHHINYNKKNNKKENLITLCVGCNSKANFNRKFWIDYFSNMALGDKC